MLLGSSCRKATCKHVDEIDPRIRSHPAIFLGQQISSGLHQGYCLLYLYCSDFEPPRIMIARIVFGLYLISLSQVRAYIAHPSQLFQQLGLVKWQIFNLIYTKNIAAKIINILFAKELHAL